MARSIGEAAAQGIERGFRLAMDVDTQQRSRERQERQDQQQEEDRRYNRTRIERADKVAALGAQEQMLRSEGEALAAGTPDEATQQSFAQRVRTLGEAKNKLLSEQSGYDLSAEQAAGAEDLKAIQTGDVSKLKPGALTRALTVHTKRPPADYLRIDGKPAPVEVAAADFLEGMKSGDQDRALRGLNVLFAPDLNKGVGEPSPHGGTIVGKRIENLVPDPNSSPEDPRVIPTLRVYVNNGKREASGDEIRARRAADPDAPEGATGWYLAPMTKDRSSRPDAAVRSIGTRDGIERVGQIMHLVELMNQPQALQQLELDAQSGWDPQQYLRALSSMGVKTKKATTTKYTSVPRGGSVLATETDAQGNVVSERRIEGNPVESTRRGSLQQTLDGIAELEADGTLTPDEADARRRAAVARSTTGTKAQGLGGATSGKGGGSGDKTNDKKLGRMLQSLKEDRLSLEKKKDAALAEYKAEIGEGASKKVRAEAKAAYERKLATLEGEDERLRKKIDEIDAKLEFGADNGAPEPKGLGAARPGRGKLTKDQAAKQFGF